MKVYLLEQHKIQFVLLQRLLAGLNDIELISLPDFDSGFFEIALEKEPCILISGLGLKRLGASEFLQRLAMLDAVKGLLLLSDASSDILESVEIFAKNLGIAHVRSLPIPVTKTSIAAATTQLISAIKTVDVPTKRSRHTEVLDAEALSDALYNQKFVPYFQPQVCAQKRNVVGFELLGRLHHQDQVIYPGDFIPELLDSGLICHYTLHLIQTAIRQARLYGFSDKLLSVNVDYVSLMEPGFAHDLLAILKKENFPSHLFEIEVTETSCPNSLYVIANLTEIRMAGISVAIDDFGTGFSGLNELLHLPFNVIKLDRTHVARVNKSQKAFHVLKGIQQMANDLEMKTVAEGIETEQNADAMSALGVGRLQGFYYSPAVKAVKVPELIEKINLAALDIRMAQANIYKVVS
ncbi:EAL domain-containing protein [Catenovulum sp. SM1970]|uniref:EAL domain-containing protein n=1 Tax=Marinifaba aquimaris TaxID=2741323 RepID=UPI001573EA33|nr:EAL domain-containing protein [Marinifaba aquimaris]NTS78112.1 EAL domain-containing protein [Marinifaba aquimaris]